MATMQTLKNSLVLQQTLSRLRKVPRRLAFRLTVILSFKAKYNESLHTSENHPFWKQKWWGETKMFKFT